MDDLRLTLSSFEKRLELSESELNRERRDSTMLRQMRRNSKAEETKLFEEKRRNIDLQKDLQKAVDDLNAFKVEASRETSSIAREADLLKEEVVTLRSQKESLEGILFSPTSFCLLSDLHFFIA